MENQIIDNIIQTSDANLIAKLNKDVQTLHHKIEPDLFKPFNESEMRHYFEVMLKIEGVVGYVILHIDQICVESRFKGLGLGKKLVDHAKELAKSNNIARVEMNFWTQNANSGEFFSHEGFEVFNKRMVFKF